MTPTRRFGDVCVIIENVFDQRKSRYSKKSMLEDYDIIITK